jgi:hypothetical protein
VTPIATATGKLLRPIRLSYTPGGPGASPVISPDGATLYVVGANPDNKRWYVIPIQTATNTAGRPIRVAQEPVAMVITP